MKVGLGESPFLARSGPLVGFGQLCAGAWSAAAAARAVWRRAMSFCGGGLRQCASQLAREATAVCGSVSSADWDADELVERCAALCRLSQQLRREAERAAVSAERCARLRATDRAASVPVAAGCDLSTGGLTVQAAAKRRCLTGACGSGRAGGLS